MNEEKKNEIRALFTVQGVYGKVKGVSFTDYYSVTDSYSGIKSLDLFCPQCKVNKTFVYFRRQESGLMGEDTYQHLGCNHTGGRLLSVMFKCPTCGLMLYYAFYHKDNTMIKLAQYPSLFDVSRDELKKYKNNGLIDENSFNEIYKAEICASENYFVASYTYMRRVYENMLLSVFRQNIDDIGLTEEEYRRKRSDEKMELIKPFLAVDDEIYKPLYALLSAGVHSLTEEECCNHYTLLKSILLEILIEQKAKAERTKKRKEIQALYSQYKSNTKKSE